MLIKWVLRITFIFLLFIQISLFGYFIKNRKKNENLVENKLLNLILVIVYNTFCYVPVLLPDDIRKDISLFHIPLTNYWYSILGLIICIAGAILLITTILKRKVIGVQDTEGRLLTGGIYHFARHPIYLGIILIASGMVISAKNISGLIVLPFIIIANVLEAKIEEKLDMEAHFKEEYRKYKKETKMFGPIWFWLILIILTSIPLLFPFIMNI